MECARLIDRVNETPSTGEMAELVMAQDCETHHATGHLQQTLTSLIEGSLEQFPVEQSAWVRVPLSSFFASLASRFFLISVTMLRS